MVPPDNRLKEYIINTFESLGLPQTILDAVAALGYTEPTPVQEQAIPAVLEGRDVLAAAKTGTGKTAAFALPSMGTLAFHTEPAKPRMVCVTPTRELAIQISDTCTAIARHTGHSVLTVVGGLSYDPQINGLNKGVDVLIATPGRLIDLMKKDAVDLSDVDVLVLDEADRMVDMGFWPQVSEIVDATPARRQTLLFSATIDSSVEGAVENLLSNPVMVEIARKGDVADTIDQYIIKTPRRLRPTLLNALIRVRGSERVIVFTRTKGCADNCVRRLRNGGITAEAIHANRSQAQRKHALENFREGITDVLVATDVLARGIDISEVRYVVNYDLPEQIEDYVHRIGRTGRAGEAGCAISFVMPETRSLLKQIQSFIMTEIPELDMTADQIVSAADMLPKLEAVGEPRRRDIPEGKGKGKGRKGGKGAKNGEKFEKGRSGKGRKADRKDASDQRKQRTQEGEGAAAAAKHGTGADSAAPAKSSAPAADGQSSAQTINNRAARREQKRKDYAERMAKESRRGERNRADRERNDARGGERRDMRRNDGFGEGGYSDARGGKSSKRAKQDRAAANRAESEMTAAKAELKKREDGKRRKRDAAIAKQQAGKNQKSGSKTRRSNGGGQNRGPKRDMRPGRGIRSQQRGGNRY